MIENILLALFIVLFCAKILGSICEHFGLDSSLGELLAGIILGSSVLGLVDPHKIESFALIGSVLILFVAGLKQPEAKEMYKDVKALTLGLTLLLVTTAAMAAFFFFVGRWFGTSFTIMQSLMLAIAFAIIDIGVPAKIMISKGLMGTSFGRVVVNSAIINIVLGLVLFTIFTLFFSTSLMSVIIKLGGIALFVVITYLLVHGLSRISRFVMRMHVEEAEFSLAILLVLALAYLTDVIGFTSVLGAFIAGTIVAQSPFAGTRSFADRMKAISFGLFVPLFFAWFGLEINLAEIFRYAAFALAIFFTYIIIRFVITYIFAKRYGFKVPFLISTSMLSVDVESLVVLLITLQLGIFTDKLPLTLFAPSVFLSTLLIVILMAIFSRIEKTGTKEKRRVESE